MVGRDAAQAWLDRYVSAWERYDPAAIGDLFTEDAVYYYFTPCAEPLQGRDAIVAAWLRDPEPHGTYEAFYRPILVDGDVAVARGRTRYFDGPDRASLKAEWDNLFVIRFAVDGRCAEWREWNMRRPTHQR